MQKLFLLAILLLTSLGAQAEGNRPTTPADLEHIVQLQRKVDKLGFGPLGPDNYTLCKARAWLDMALVEYHEEERSGLVQDAVEQAAQLLAKLEADPKYLGLETPHPYASEKVRQDLWDVADSLKNSGDLNCVGCKLAKLEVQLVWAGHDKWEAGWSHAEAYTRIAENLAYEVQADAEKCHPSPKPAGETIIIKKHTLIDSLLFDFDISLVSQGEQKLSELVEQLKKWQKIESIQLTGHADRLNETGSSEYNMKLSQRRVELIRDYMVSHGLPADLIKSEAMGDTRPLVSCAKQRAGQDRAALIKCLQPNRRVDVVVDGVRGDEK